MKTAFNNNSLHVVAEVGQNWISATWVATVFSFAASVFWMMSMCCCSGRTSKVMGTDKKGKGTKAEHTPYTYQRVESPTAYKGHGESGTPMLPFHAAQPKPAGFEPMRHK